MANRIREGVLWTGAVLGVLCMAWTVVMFAFGLTPLVFTSGSMSPQIKAGDLAFSRTIEASQIKVDDVVSVVNEKGVRITHRVVRVDPTAEGAVVTLKGDANKQADIEPYEVTTVERVSFSVPKAGYVVEAVGSPVGMFLGGLLAATALFIAFGRRDHDGDDRPTPGATPLAPTDPEASTTGPAAMRRIAAVGVGVTVLAAGTTVVQPTTAAFSDEATVGAQVVSASVQPPASLTCTNVGTGGGSVTLSFPHADTRYDYAVTIVNDSSGATVSSRSGTVTGTGAAGSSLSMAVARNFTTWGLFDAGAVQYTARVSSRLKSSPTWRSTDTTVKLYETRGLFEFSYRVYCGQG